MFKQGIKLDTHSHIIPWFREKLKELSHKQVLSLNSTDNDSLGVGSMAIYYENSAIQLSKKKRVQLSKK